MAKANVVHSGDACTIIFAGDPRRPEPSTGVVKFPGGHMEVSRCSDGTYWAHLAVVDSANVIGSRLDFQNAAEHGIRSVLDVPHGEHVRHIALRIANAVPHFDPDA